MAGTIIADFLQPQSNVGLSIVTPTGNTVMASINSAGIFSGTGSLLLANTGNILTTGNVTATGIITGNTVTVANTFIPPTWTTATRTITPVTAQLGYNTTYGGYEVYNGTSWSTISGGPAFSAFNSIATSVPNVTWTKLQNSNKEFDTNNNYDSTTNYRFTPTVAGYYQVNGAWAQNGSTGISSVAVYKNGNQYKVGSQIDNNISYVQAIVSCLVYLNGTTDYIELYGYQSAGGTNTAYTGTQPSYGYFQAYLVRGA